MSLRLAARRLGLPATTTTPYAPSSPLSSQRRNKWSVNVFKGWGSKTAKSSSSEPSSSDYQLGQSLSDPKSRREIVSQQNKATTSSSAPDSSNIFSDELDTPGGDKDGAAETAGMQTAEKKTRGNTALVLDPDPRSRARWERRKVIQMVRRSGPPTREERIAMTERALTHKSDWIPTSTKKLVMLARQIAGKSVDDAITQMQWSKKKMAAEVKYYLEEARDTAIAQRGMGLGAVNGEAKAARPRKIRTKDGKWVDVKDPTGLYVAESWVGRGEWLGKEIDYKGRGRMGVIVHPKTSITVVLKEEKTRIREYEEREAKKKAEGPWVHHPNRPIHGQRPYYTW